MESGEQLRAEQQLKVAKELIELQNHSIAILEIELFEAVTVAEMYGPPYRRTNEYEKKRKEVDEKRKKLF